MFVHVGSAQITSRLEPLMDCDGTFVSMSHILLHLQEGMGAAEMVIPVLVGVEEVTTHMLHRPHLLPPRVEQVVQWKVKARPRKASVLQLRTRSGSCQHFHSLWTFNIGMRR